MGVFYHQHDSVLSNSEDFDSREIVFYLSLCLYFLYDDRLWAVLSNCGFVLEMAGVYIHIPFCKKACHYCDFHFSTSLKKKEAMLDALKKEITLRANEIMEPIETIYFGGGTPSLLSSEELSVILQIVFETFDIAKNPEITLEANPDDISEEKMESLLKTSVNRVSLGVQSFYEEDLRWMNRAHDVADIERAIRLIKANFKNFSIDLIYGIPGMSKDRWSQNLSKAIAHDIPHLSCYALTVEPDTALYRFIEKGITANVDDEVAQQHHDYLIHFMEQHGYVNYEFSNFAKPKYFSRNNMAYWQGKSYLGIGPSAHSYNGKERTWNVANNILYINSIEKGFLPVTRETLSKRDRYNEYVMTRLRTQQGIMVNEVQQQFGEQFLEYMLKMAEPHLDAHRLFLDEQSLKVTKKGKFLSDGIASDLFLINLEDNSNS